MSPRSKMSGNQNIEAHIGKIPHEDWSYAAASQGTTGSYEKSPGRYPFLAPSEAV